jgi:uroporphyrinogen-III decarboxylase
MLMGTELWMELLFFAPDDVRERVMEQFLSVTTEFAVSWANAQLEAGADAIVLADGMSSGSSSRTTMTWSRQRKVSETSSRLPGT